MEFNTIYGYIKIDTDYYKSVSYIKSLPMDNSYPFINTNMFSFGDYEIPYYYENAILGFAATYKCFGYDLEDWNEFILKIEKILRNIDFENAQFHIDSTLGNYTLFWTKIGCSLKGAENEKKYLEEYNLIKTDEWYFGFGERNVFTGFLKRELQFHEDLRNEPILNFKYPI